MLLQSAMVCYYKVRQLFLLQSATAFFITKCDLFYLLHSLTVCYYKVQQFFNYKVREVFVVPPGIIATYNRPFHGCVQAFYLE